VLERIMEQVISRQGFMFVLSSPSGAGKTTVARMLLEKDKNLVLSLSVTTRPKRPAEVDGKDYIFVDEVKFHEIVESGNFLEHANVMGHWYGTPKASVETALENGQDVLFDIDWQGMQQLQQSANHILVTIFILPPSWEELERRLRSRAQDSDEVVKNRMDNAAEEISHWSEYDHVLINEDLDNCVANAHEILQSERSKRSSQLGLEHFIETLIKASVKS